MVGRMIEDFAEEVGHILREESFLLPDETGARRLPEIYAHTLPPGTRGQPPRTPWVLVSLYSGEQSAPDEPRRATVHITCMVYDAEQDMQGYRDAANLLEVICRRLYNQSFVAGRYEVLYPYQFAMLDDARYPYYSAGLAIKVELPGVGPQNETGGFAYV